jgi:alginate O-acetyltransferase complex protein AlgI
MEITTFSFAVFVIVAAIGFRWLPQCLKNIWLLFACMIFIISWSWTFLIVLLSVAAINFYLGKHVADARRGKQILWMGISINLLALLVLKYANFYLPELTVLLTRIGVQDGAGGIQILVPIGISFITLQMISYLLDIHNQRMQAEAAFVNFAVYVLYFPKILAGPIERAKTFLPRLKSPQNLTGKSILQNFTLVLMGLIRKVIFADTLIAMIPAQAFQQPSQYPAPLLAIWLVVYAFAIYNDFAGYTSMVRGISGFFGIELTNNFKVPYFSRNFSEFWNRWHISLSSWLRDYIYFPLSRWLRKKIPDQNHAVNLVIPPVLTMLASGLWHGLGWNTLLWGGLHGVYLVMERVIGLWRPRSALTVRPKWQQFISAVLIFFFILMAWVPFHTGVIPAVHYWQNLFMISNWGLSNYLAYIAPLIQNEGLSRASTILVYLFPFLQAALILVPALGLDLIQYKDEFRFQKWPAWLQVALLVLVLAILFLLSFAEKGAPFIYQNF